MLSSLISPLTDIILTIGVKSKGNFNHVVCLSYNNTCDVPLQYVASAYHQASCFYWHGQKPVLRYSVVNRIEY